MIRPPLHHPHPLFPMLAACMRAPDIVDLDVPESALDRVLTPE